jgi:guanine deaminase
MSDQQHFIQQAVDMSRKAMNSGDGAPFGCVIVKEGNVVGQGWNRVNATCDPTAHAEVEAIRNASANLQNPDLSDCELYTSGEPCPMCLAAAYWAGITRVYYANTIADASAAGYEDVLIYEELSKPAAERMIAMTHLPNADAQKIWAEWIATNPDTNKDTDCRK